MRPENHEDQRLDRRLREHLEADSVTVERLVRRVLESRKPARRPALRLTAAVVVCAVATVLALPFFDRTEPPPLQETRLSMINVGQVIVARDGRGGGYVLRSGATAPGGEAQQGQIMIHRRLTR